jgi:hypothetical protein
MSLKVRTQDETWVDKNGNRIPISAMSEEYAKNCLRMLVRRHRQEVEAEYYRRFRKEMTRHFYENTLSAYTKGVI